MFKNFQLLIIYNRVIIFYKYIKIILSSDIAHFTYKSFSGTVEYASLQNRSFCIERIEKISEISFV